MKNILDTWKQPVLYTWTRDEARNEVIVTKDGQRFVFRSIASAKIWLSGFEKGRILRMEDKSNETI